MSDSPRRDDAFWRQELSPTEYQICREKGTERPFTGEYWDSKRPGTYVCRCCKEALFSSSSKYDSGSGWPSFYQPIADGVVEELRDSSHGMIRTEALCANCGCHLGHVFTDGPEPTGLRFCVNSASLELDEDASDQNPGS